MEGCLPRGVLPLLGQASEVTDLGVSGLARFQKGLDRPDPLCELGVLCPGLLELPMETTQLLTLAFYLHL